VGFTGFKKNILCRIKNLGKLLPVKQHPKNCYVYYFDMNAQILTFFLRPAFWCLLSLSILGAAACQKNDDYLPAVVDIPIAFQVKMQEKLQPGPRPLQFQLSSMEALDCENYTIAYDYERKGQRLNLTLTDFALADPCIAGEGFASTLLDLGVLQPGSYPLTISLRNTIKNKGTLTVSDDLYSLKMETSYGIWTTPTAFHRIPDHTLWGGVFPGADSLAYLADDFVEALRALTSPADLPSSRDFGHFRIDSNGNVVLRDVETPGPGLTFAFHFEGDKREIVDLAASYRALGDPGFLLFLFDAEGNQY
jgi:hypothetical protein